MQVQPLTDEVCVVFDISQHEVVPQPAHSRSLSQTLLVQLYEDVDDEVVVGTSSHQAGDQVLAHLQLGLTDISCHAMHVMEVLIFNKMFRKTWSLFTLSV